MPGPKVSIVKRLGQRVIEAEIITKKRIPSPWVLSQRVIEAKIITKNNLNKCVFIFLFK
jgi:hypothetical protein